MSDAILQAQVDAARAYETLFVPALFGQWVGKLAEAAHLQKNHKVLDVACGTGVLAREAVLHVGEQGTVIGLDPNPGMLLVAQERAPNITWQEGVAEKLPYPDGYFDATISQFGLMFFQDPLKAINEMLRVTKSSGHLVVAVWDAIENIPGYSTELKLIEHFAGKAAAEAVRAPFVLGQPSALHSMFEKAGAMSISVTTLKGTARFPSIQTMVAAELRGWLPVMDVHLEKDLINIILENAEKVLAPYTTAEGAVIFEVSAHFVTAKTPLALVV